MNIILHVVKKKKQSLSYFLSYLNNQAKMRMKIYSPSIASSDIFHADTFDL